MSDDKEPVKCPNCGTPMGIEMVAKLKGESRVRIGLEPLDGELLGGRLVAEKIEAFCSLLEKSGEAIGVCTHVVLESMNTNETGRFEATFLVMRDDRVKEREERLAAKEKSAAK